MGPLDNYWKKVVRGSGERLDVYLAHSELKFSRSQIKDKIKKREILVNGEQTKPSYTVRRGDVIEALYSPPKPLEITPEPIPLSIIYEDEDIIVIDKQKGLVVHPAKGHPNGTLINGLLYYCSELSSYFGIDRPGVVHRLDIDTTGVIIFAKSERVHSDIAVQFQEREVSKVYLAVVWGSLSMKKGDIKAPVGRHPIKRKLMAVTPLNSKESITHFKVLYSYPFTSILKLILETGRTHQIRVHLLHYGYPIVGDPQYGGRDRRILQRLGGDYAEEFDHIMGLIDRQALHAASLTIMHPVKKKKMRFIAPLHKDMKDLIQYLTYNAGEASLPRSGMN
ncbi:RluA family pseudouridine synthase [candidate division WOR-3 bacterium]|nr:RluA family pseudouridine synthase [candidate division WOR-3 bacterium]